MAIEDSKRLLTVARVQNVTNAVDALAHIIAGTTVPTYETPSSDDGKRLATAVSFDALKTAVEAVQAAVSGKNTSDATLAGKVDTLIGSDTGKSARTIAAEELAAQLIPANAAESLDTLQEIAAWIQAHPSDASQMAANIAALKSALSHFITDTNGTYSATADSVKDYIDAAITALNVSQYATNSDLTALAGRVTTAEGDIDAIEGILSGFGGTGNPATVKGYVDDKDTAMDARVDALEALGLSVSNGYIIQE